MPLRAKAPYATPDPIDRRNYDRRDHNAHTPARRRTDRRDPSPGVIREHATQGAAVDAVFATAPELQYLAPEDYKLPAPDPVLLASANRMLVERVQLLEGTRDELVRQHEFLREELSGVSKDVDDLREKLGTAESQRDAWRAIAARFDCDTPAGFEEHVAGLHRRLADIEDDSADLAASHDILASVMPEADPRDPSDLATEELARIVKAELQNARALNAKLQHLLDGARHENEALRTASEAFLVRDHTEHDLEAIPLRELLQQASLRLEAGQAITIHPGEHCSISVFDKDFVCVHAEAPDLLTAAATLQRAEIVL